MFAEMLAEATRDDNYDADRDVLRAADQTETHSAETGSARPSGRVLPSLVESSPWMTAPTEAIPPRRATGRAIANGAAAQTTVVASVSRPRDEMPRGRADVHSMTDSGVAPRPEPQARTSDIPTAFPASETERSPNGARDAITSAATRKPRRRADRTKKQAIPEAAPGPFGAELVIPDALPSDASNRADGASQERRRSIVARYVFGTELKLGERWRQRLRHTR
jgi:hypothetical protein